MKTDGGRFLKRNTLTGKWINVSLSIIFFVNAVRKRVSRQGMLQRNPPPETASAERDTGIAAEHGF